MDSSVQQPKHSSLLFNSPTAKSSSPLPKGLLTIVSFSVTKHFFRQLHSLQLHRIPVPLRGCNGSQQSFSSIKAWTSHRSKHHYPRFIDEETKPKGTVVPALSIPTSKLETDPIAQNHHTLILTFPLFQWLNSFKHNYKEKKKKLRSKEKQEI